MIVVALEGEKPRNLTMQHIRRFMHSTKNTAWHMEGIKEFKLTKHKLQQVA